MPKSAGPNQGFALLCTRDGTISEVIHDCAGKPRELSPGKPFFGVFDRISSEKARRFISEISEHGAAFDWELNLPEGDMVTGYHFSGIGYDEDLFLVAAKSRDDLVDLYEDLLRIGNEQTNRLRALVKQTEALPQASPEDTMSRFTMLNSELMNLQREMSRKNAELERLNGQKDRFLAMAAHDIRGTLSVIDIYSQFLRTMSSATMDGQSLEYLDRIRSSVGFLNQLVSDFLDISTIESGKLKLNLSPCNLEELTARCVELNRVLAETKGISIRIEAGDKVGSFIMDGSKMEQVLNNLLNNAVKFSFPGSGIRVNVTKRGESALIHVSDAGQGIPSEEMGKLFLPFERTTVKGTDGEKSSGLGLTIAHKIVKEHGGRIDVQSTVGMGTTFTVDIPIRRTMDSS